MASGRPPPAYRADGAGGRRGLLSGGAAGSGAGAEVLRRDLVEELAELLDLVLLLVGDLDAHLVEQVVGPVDRRTGADGDSPRVRRGRAHHPPPPPPTPG